MKTKGSLKGLLFLFVILAVIAGTVCAIIFWPQKPEEIKGSLNHQTKNVLAADGDFMTSFSNFEEYSQNYRNTKSDGKRSFLAAKNIFLSLQEYFSFTSYAFEFADFAHYEKGDIKNAKKDLNRAEGKIKQIAAFLDEKNESLTQKAYNTRYYEIPDAELVWFGAAEEITNAFKIYYDASVSLAKVFRKNVVSGIYANEFCFQTIDGISYYLNYFVENFDNFFSQAYSDMAGFFKVYVDKYIKPVSNKRVVGEFLISESLRNEAVILKDFDNEMAPLTLKELVLKKFDASGFSFTTAQYEKITKVTTFYKGGLLI